MMTRYSIAKERYAAIGIDTDAAIEKLRNFTISMHCWQGDDVRGLEEGGADLSGGIQTTGNYPGRARNAGELMKDFEFALSEIGGRKRMNLHASYRITDRKCDRDSIEPEDYRAWVDFAKRNGIGLDFNPTCFSHPMVRDNLTLSSPCPEVRNFWIEHCRRSRRVASFFARELGGYSMNNIWIPDGFKDIPADRLGPRSRLKSALDEIFSEKLDGVIDTVESKTFGIGLESFTVGSNEFYCYYAATHDGVYQLMDTGHYHPTEVVSEKISSILCYKDHLPLHVSRPVRWDSDHVVILDDELKEIAREIVRNGALDKVLLGLDFFDASINRTACWIIGTRNMQKAILIALLEPHESMKRMQDEARFTDLLATHEALKSLDWGAVWEEFLSAEGLDDDQKVLTRIHGYEKEILSQRC